MKQIIVVQEDEKVFNIFDRDDFNEDGWLIGHEDEEGYNIEDFDIVAQFDYIEDACEYVDRLL